MRYAVVLAACLYTSLVLYTDAVLYSPWIQQKHGPLYEGLKLLIADEEFHADLMRNETEQQLQETRHVMQEALDRMVAYEAAIEERLKALNAVVRPPAYKRCYKQHERDIARFNRELLHKSITCKQSLDAGLAQLQNETEEEIEFVRTATAVVRNVAVACDISALKRNNSNQAGVTLCVVANIGELEQHLLDASQYCLDIIANVALNNGHKGDGAGGGDSCREFYELKHEFDVVYEKLSKCMANETA